VSTERHDAEKFVTRSAHWRDEEVTDKQRDMLKRMGLANINGLNKGQASQMISQWMASRK